jgi:protein SCO1
VQHTIQKQQNGFAMILEPHKNPAITIAMTLALCASLAPEATWAGQANGSQNNNNKADVRAAEAIAARPELAIGRSDDYDYDVPEPGSYTLPVFRHAADGEVLDTAGRRQSLAELVRGRVSIVSFIYLRCASPNACPRATGVLRKIHQISEQDPVIANQTRLITMSFDPEHDTPQRMANYAKWFGSDKPSAEWLFLTANSERELKPILKAYDQTVDRKQNMNDPLGPYFHPVRVFLIDREGRIRNIYSFGMLDPRLILTDVRTLLMEEQPGVAAASRGTMR